MDVQGYDTGLEGLSKLRCLSITELVFGIIGALGIIASFWSRRAHGVAAGNVGNLISVALLIAAGALGVSAVKKARLQIRDHNTFRICGILNIVLCVLYCIELLVFVVGGILLAVSAGSGLQLLEQFGIDTSGTVVTTNYNEDDYFNNNKAVFSRAVSIMVIVALVISIIVLILMIALTATAAKIARRNQAIILSAPSGAVAGYPLQPPGYTQYSAVKTQEMHHA